METFICLFLLVKSLRNKSFNYLKMSKLSEIITPEDINFGVPHLHLVMGSGREISKSPNISRLNYCGVLVRTI